ncbi:MAG: tetratricopeptide repeat protein [Planctomycetota bacterium]|nr:tetratricopeptide repeat protein [Planctomycetota bacterium]
MSRVVRSLSCLVLVGALAAAPVRSGEWFSRDFQCRRALEIETIAPGVPACCAKFSTHGLLSKDGRDIRVVNAAGKTVGHEILQAGPGDQVEILFDSLAAKQGTLYYAYFGNPTATPPKPWLAPAGVIMEVRRKGQGGCNTWPEYQKMFENSKELMGRTLRPKIFDGYNPMGPNENFVSYYRAYFQVPAPGTYKFATNSDKASFLLINGKLVAQYPGWHNMWEGRFGQHAGTVELTAATHLLEYYHVQTQGETATMAAWQKPGDKNMSLMEDGCFVPIGRARAKTIERLDGKTTLDFAWAPVDHLVVEGRCMVRYAFECRAKASPVVKWSFGDGTAVTLDTKESLKLKHGYITPGTYTVTLSPEGDSTFLPLKQTVVVEPVWPQREEFDDARWKDYRRALLTRLENGEVRGADVAALLTYAVELKEKELLAAGAAHAWKVAKEIPAGDHAQVFLNLGLHLQSQLRDYAQADRAFIEAIGGPGDARTKARAKLHRAGLLIHIIGKPQEALGILKTIHDNELNPPNEPVLRAIYLADAYAALGQREEAVKRYEGLRTVVPLTDRAYAVGRRGRLLSIRSYIKSGDYESALQELANIEWETPQERMADDTGLLRAECYLAQKEYQRAVVLLDRLLKVNPGSPRAPEMLFLLAKTYCGMNRTELAEATYARMRKEQPYAAETALAADLLAKR